MIESFRQIFNHRNAADLKSDTPTDADPAAKDITHADGKGITRELRDPILNILSSAAKYACKRAVTKVCGGDQTTKNDPLAKILGSVSKTAGCQLSVSLIRLKFLPMLSHKCYPS